MSGAGQHLVPLSVFAHTEVTATVSAGLETMDDSKRGLETMDSRRTSVELDLRGRLYTPRVQVRFQAIKNDGRETAYIFWELVTSVELDLRGRLSPPPSDTVADTYCSKVALQKISLLTGTSSRGGTLLPPVDAMPPVLSLPLLPSPSDLCPADVLPGATMLLLQIYLACTLENRNLLVGGIKLVREIDEIRLREKFPKHGRRQRTACASSHETGQRSGWAFGASLSDLSPHGFWTEWLEITRIGCCDPPSKKCLI